MISNINATVALSIAGTAVVALLGLSGLFWAQGRALDSLRSENAALQQAVADLSEITRIYEEYRNAQPNNLDPDTADCVLRRLADPGGEHTDCGDL